MPLKIQKKFEIAEIDNPLQNDEVDKRLREQGYIFSNKPSAKLEYSKSLNSLKSLNSKDFIEHETSGFDEENDNNNNLLFSN